ncbi:MAG: hypothetical protein JWM54_743 [Acidobacteriaceae bacterium]|nr:hypothetical protein [Acidobacteriaceae bacterium]
MPCQHSLDSRSRPHPKMLCLLARKTCVVLTLLLPAGARAAQAPVLPNVSFYNLNKQRITLPADLHSDRNLLLLYFQLTQQPQVDGWNSAIEHWHSIDPSLMAYTSLVSPQKNILARWWQNASIRSSSPDNHRWSTTLPLYVDKRSFERQLGIDSENQPVLLLLDRSGHVLNKVGGSATEGNQALVRAALQAAGSPPLTPVSHATPPHNAEAASPHH